MDGEDLRWEEKEYSVLEEKIRRLVKALHCFGIKTIFSCEGHIRTNPCHVGVLPWPWIIIQDPPEKIDKLEEAIRGWNHLNPNHEWMLSVRRIHGSFTQSYIRNTMMRERPGTIVRALVSAKENLSLSAEVLTELQKSANKLADFLKSK